RLCRRWRGQRPGTLSRSECACIECRSLITRPNVRSKAVVKKTRPRTFKISRRMGAAKSFLHKFRTFCFWTAKQRVKQVDFRKSALCVVNRIAAENEKLLDSPIAYV